MPSERRAIGGGTPGHNGVRSGRTTGWRQIQCRKVYSDHNAAKALHTSTECKPEQARNAVNWLDSRPLAKKLICFFSSILSIYAPVSESQHFCYMIKIELLQCFILVCFG